MCHTCARHSGRQIHSANWDLTGSALAKWIRYVVVDGLTEAAELSLPIESAHFDGVGQPLSWRQRKS
jgi:hypothetical protein